MRIVKLTILAFLLSTGAAIAGEGLGLRGSLSDTSKSSFSWTGFYGGVEAGHSWQNDQTERAAVGGACFDSGPGGDNDCAAKGKGTIVGLYAGYNRQFGNLVAGVEGSYTRIDTMFNDAALVTVDDAWAVKARAGYALSRVQLYALMGATYVSTSSPSPGLSESDWGMIYGAGVDFAATDHLIFGAQLTHSRFKEFAELPIDAQMTNLMARVGYKF